MSEGSFTVLFRNDMSEVLLVRRSDAPVWDLPGGVREQEESVECCAVREALEETGYEVLLCNKIGEYLRPQYKDLQHVFTGDIVGGCQIEIGDETSRIEWFNVKKLPILMIPNRRRQIDDALNEKENLNVVLLDSWLILKIQTWMRGIIRIIKK